MWVQASAGSTAVTPQPNTEYILTFISSESFTWESHQRSALNSQCAHRWHQSTRSWTALSPAVLPLASTSVIINVSFMSQRIEEVMMHSQSGTSSTKDAFQAGGFFFFLTPREPFFFVPWKDLRGLYLDQSVLDDPAYVKPPLCDVGVVVVQVGWEGQEVGLEILCKVEGRDKMWN